MKHLKWYAAAALLYVLLSYQPFIVGVLVDDIDPFVALTQENGVIENIGALGFLASAVLFGIAYIRSGRPEHWPDHTLLKRLFYLGLAVVFLFAAGEEVSWGQWIFGFEPAGAISGGNIQGEFNLHNQELAGGGTPSALMLRLFNLFWLIFAVAIPITALVYRPARPFFEKFVPVIPPILGLPLILSHCAMRCLIVITMGTYRQVHYLLGEVCECNLSVLFAIITAYIAFESLSLPAGNQKEALARVTAKAQLQR
jgi:hypothetical protein